jgi:hypothetical protein
MSEKEKDLVEVSPEGHSNDCFLCKECKKVFNKRSSLSHYVSMRAVRLGSLGLNVLNFVSCSPFRPHCIVYSDPAAVSRTMLNHVSRHEVPVEEAKQFVVVADGHLVKHGKQAFMQLERLLTGEVSEREPVQAPPAKKSKPAAVASKPAAQSNAPAAAAASAAARISPEAQKELWDEEERLFGPEEPNDAAMPEADATDPADQPKAESDQKQQPAASSTDPVLPKVLEVHSSPSPPITPDDKPVTAPHFNSPPQASTDRPVGPGLEGSRKMAVEVANHVKEWQLPDTPSRRTIWPFKCEHSVDFKAFDEWLSVSCVYRGAHLFRRT